MDGITNSMDMSLSKCGKHRETWCATVHGIAKSQTQLTRLSGSSSSKITADGNCSNKIERCLILGRKAMINLDSTLKSRNITLPIKVHLVKAMVFPVVTYGYERWSIKRLSTEELMLSNCGAGKDS